MSDAKRWLRRYDTEKQKWTNRCMPYNDELARDQLTWKLVDDAEAAKCAAALALEKSEACRAMREKLAVEKPIIVPKIDKMTAPVSTTAHAPAPALVPVEVDTPIEATVVPDEPAAAVVEGDGLDALDVLEMRKIIDAEGLPVKKTYGPDNMRAGIREARKAKAATKPVEQ